MFLFSFRRSAELDDINWMTTHTQQGIFLHPGAAIIWLLHTHLTNFRLQATVMFWAEMTGGRLHKRILLLGPTGVDKVTAVRRVAARMKASLGHEL